MEFCQCKKPRPYKFLDMEITERVLPRGRRGINNKAKDYAVPIRAAICEHCDRPIYGPSEKKEIKLHINNQLRKEKGLLSPQEIISIRKRLGLTVEQFAKYLKANPKTIYAWEANYCPSNLIANELIRIKCSDTYIQTNQGEIQQLKSAQ